MNHRLKVKCSKEQFRKYFKENPVASIPEIMDKFDICQASAYRKKAQWHKQNPLNPESSEIAVKIHREAYNEGYNTGFFNGVAIGILAGDVLKSSGMGVSDIVSKIAGWIKPTAESV